MVTVNAAPTFDVSAIPLPDPAYTYIANQPFTTLTLPPAGGGTAPLSYTLTPDSSIPSGLSFNANMRTLAGRPTEANPDAALTYTATDANGAAITAVFSLSGRLTVTSVSATDGIYTDGDSVLITIAFSEAVAVSTGSTPQLALTTGNSDGDGTATYTSGSGTAALTFTHDVIDGDDIGNLAYSDTTALSLNSGNILNAGGIAATLTLPAVGGANSLSDSSAVVLDNTAPVFTRASTTDNRVLVPVSANTDAASVFYNANAIDRDRRPADTGITYAVVAGTGALSFAIDSMSGALSPTVTLATVATFSLEITATDEVNNVATQYLSVSVVDALVVTITNNIAAGKIANIVDGALTFTFELKEEVTGFDASDISVGGGEKDTFATIVPGMIYTLVAPPLSNTNGGVLTVTVAAAAATSTGLNPRMSIEAMATQEYDTLAPAMPGIEMVDIINIAERNAGISLSGDVESGASIALCIGPDDVACTDGTRASVPAGTATWSFMLSRDVIDTLAQGENTVQATATDAAGNPGESASRPFTVDTEAPAVLTVGTISEDDYINATEQGNGVTIGGKVSETGVSVSLCFGGDGSATCTGTTQAGTVTVTDADLTWSYTLAPAELTEGEKTVQAAATDASGNVGEYGDSKSFTVDLTAPLFSGDTTGAVAVGTNTDVIVYNATATDVSGTADEDIIYTLSGTDADRFNIDQGRGEVTYKVVQTSVTIDPHHVIMITATREVTIQVRDDVPTVTITNNVTSEYTNAAVTFTFTFTQPIVSGGFTIDDITVDGDTPAGPLTPSIPDKRYTLVVTLPAIATNNNTLTVTVRAGAVTGLTSGIDNLEIVVIQKYDTVAPVLVDGDNMDGDTVPLSPAFDAATLTYTAGVVQEVTSVTITTTTSRSDATAVTFTGTGTGTGTAADGSTTTQTIADATTTGATVSGLTDGVNTITIMVTAADGTTVYTIDLTRAPPLTFGDSVTIDGQIYPINQDIAVLVTLTLPEASGGSGGLSYTLTPEANIPAGLTFDPATRTLSGTPTALDTRTLIYTVTDGATPRSQSH